MAPECLYGKPYAEKADVFSYGIILAEIMARIPADPEYMPRTNVSIHIHTIIYCVLFTITLYGAHVIMMSFTTKSMCLQDTLQGGITCSFKITADSCRLYN